MCWEDQPIYEYESNGGCDACDSLDGYHEDEPEPPHPYCMCTILSEDKTFTWDYEINNIESDDNYTYYDTTVYICCIGVESCDTHSEWFVTATEKGGDESDILPYLEDFAEEKAEVLCNQD